MSNLKMNRSRQQNKSLHVWARLLAGELNAAGFDMRKTLRDDWEIPWTEESIKEHIIKPISIAMYDKEHTSDLSTIEIQEIYKVIDQKIAERTGVHVEWPSREQG